MSKVRKVNPQDLEALKIVIDTNELFPSELLEDMMKDYFNNPDTQDIWLTTEFNDIPIAVAYCAPEKLTEGTYNLYLIAIHKNHQGKGIGTAIMNNVENLLKTKNVRVLLVETSGLAEFELTRKFYDQCNYHREALIRDFYREGEDKIVFWKKL
ncbi:MAG: GNAT family N-acetyltransferase [Bacteroidetes bacterium]|nr:MAG: GNAT family N-acetyltransferase [Bacteroidota bacterium]